MSETYTTAGQEGEAPQKPNEAEAGADQKDEAPEAVIGTTQKKIKRLLGQPANEKLVALRERILREIPENREGIDTRRAEDFLKEQGLKPGPYMIVDRAWQARLRTMLDEEFPNEQHDDGDIGGFYNPLLQLTVVWRDAELEALNSPVFTESMLVHELAHSSIGNLVVQDNDQMRMGALDSKKGKGAFLEEGFADLHALDYRARYLPDNVKRAIREKLGLGEDMDHLDAVFNMGTVQDREFKCVGSAFYIDKTGEYTVMESGIASSTLLLIRAAFPHVWEDLKKSRTDPRALRRVQQWFNMRGSDTWKLLRSAHYDVEWFAWAQDIVFKRVFPNGLPIS